MAHDLTTGSDNTSDEGNETQPKLGPLPARAYSKLLDIDPLSPPEEEATYSDDEFLTVMEAAPSNVPAESAHENTRFYGKSSFVVFTSQAFIEKHKDAGIRDAPERRNEYWTIPDVSPLFFTIHYRSATFQWMSPILVAPPVHFEYPDMDLMRHLVECYFDNLNILLPLLHRPSFVRSIEEGLHKVDHDFGATVLLVCAVGCRYTDDPRVTHELTTSTSCTAWKFFSQTHQLKRIHYLPHSLYEAQLYPVGYFPRFVGLFNEPAIASCVISGGVFTS